MMHDNVFGEFGRAAFYQAEFTTAAEAVYVPHAARSDPAARFSLRHCSQRNCVNGRAAFVATQISWPHDKA